MAALMLFSGASSANERHRPKKVTDLPEEARVPDEMVRVKSAKVVWVDYEALLRDFPKLAKKHKKLSAADKRALDAWVLDNFAYVSRRQLKLDGIRQEPVEADLKDSKNGYRPDAYERAAILHAELDGKRIGLVDVKGTGLSESFEKTGMLDQQVKAFKAAAGDSKRIDAIREGEYNDGWATLEGCLLEITKQRGAQALMELQNRQQIALHGEKAQLYETVGSYFLIDLGVEILRGEGNRERAAILGRQAHYGRGRNFDVPESILLDQNKNMQASFFGAIVDFESLLIIAKKITKGRSPVEIADAVAERVGQAVERYLEGDEEALKKVTDLFFEAVKEELAAARESTPAWARKQYVGALAIKELLRHPNDHIRGIAVSVLGASAEPSSEVDLELASRLFDSSEYIAYEAAVALEARGAHGNEIISALVGAVARFHSQDRSGKTDRGYVATGFDARAATKRTLSVLRDGFKPGTSDWRLLNSVIEIQEAYTFAQRDSIKAAEDRFGKFSPVNVRDYRPGGIEWCENEALGLPH